MWSNTNVITVKFWDKQDALSTWSPKVRSALNERAGAADTQSSWKTDSFTESSACQPSPKCLSQSLSLSALLQLLTCASSLKRVNWNIYQGLHTDCFATLTGRCGIWRAGTYKQRWGSLKIMICGKLCLILDMSSWYAAPFEQKTFWHVTVGKAQV